MYSSTLSALCRDSAHNAALGGPEKAPAARCSKYEAELAYLCKSTACHPSVEKGR